jgi:hypothetical protein
MTLSPRRRQVVYERFERSDKICGICGEKILPNEDTHIDHILPDGSNDLANLRVVHAFCNLSKGHKTDEEHAPLVALHAAWDDSGDYDDLSLPIAPDFLYPLSNPDHVVGISQVDLGIFRAVWMVECSCGWVVRKTLPTEVDAFACREAHELSITHTSATPDSLTLAEHEVKSLCCHGPGYADSPEQRWIGHCVCGVFVVTRDEAALDEYFQEHWDGLASD